MAIKLKIITSQGVFIDDKLVDIVNLKTIDGSVGVLANMPPFIGALVIGTMNFKIDNKHFYFYVNRGVLVVDKDRCKIITESAYLTNEQGAKLTNQSLD